MLLLLFLNDDLPASVGGGGGVRIGSGGPPRQAPVVAAVERSATATCDVGSVWVAPPEATAVSGTTVVAAVAGAVTRLRDADAATFAALRSRTPISVVARASISTTTHVYPPAATAFVAESRRVRLHVYPPAATAFVAESRRVRLRLRPDRLASRRQHRR